VKIHEPTTVEYDFDAASTYLISGGLGDLGRCVAAWMATRGARNLILLSRSGPRTEVAKTMVEDLRQLGVDVRTPKCDIADRSSLAAALVSCKDMPPIRGCVQAAGMLKVSIIRLLY
jgi:short-subunit dehydrogenase